MIGAATTAMMKAADPSRRAGRVLRLGLPLLLVSIAGQVQARTYTVLIDGVRYVPDAIVVAPGDVIVWRNKDPFPHTVTAVDRQFDSGEMPPGAEWRWVPAQAGEYRYLCTLHTTMKATVTVRKAGTSGAR